MKTLLPLLMALVIFSGCEREKQASGAGARRIALLAGASAVEESDAFFREDLISFRKALVARGWDVRGALGDKKGIFPKSVPATNEAILEETRRAASEAARGDELLLVYHSHGREAEQDWGQKSHSIVSEDRDSSGADPGFDLDVIEPLIQSASARGVRVAVVDLSCYSGMTLFLEGSSCTVTLAAPHYISLCSGRPEEHGFVSHFMKLPDPDQAISLEAQFLSARKQDRKSVNLPQISSRATPFLSDWDGLLQTIDPLDTLEDIKNYRPGFRRPLFRFPTELAAGFGQVVGMREDIEKAIGALQQDLRPQPLEPPGSRPLRLTTAELSDVLDRLEQGKSNARDLDGYSHAQRNLLTRLAGKKGALREKYSAKIEGFRARREHLELLQSRLESAIGELFSKERDLYESRSRDLGSSCRDFAL